ncbi:fused DSP-PTPase phosphatase/NAD kinase-like protein [Thiomicrorhabdus sediminis]|uniref:Protein-tyrosine-phosphatase n=1 Tax=Thiomicrorhabdus sediminis TaxID=2580412 RepID=A0A4P9K8H2_9GAMM|nr:tyrosine-protein phosphatase [Thiomicrorhabdus sediminis]QCU90706.1 protein-tyrosine-phosphatase [Thiomicrorhabdus sediminis]
MFEIKTPWQRIKAYFEFWVIDHEFVRAIYRNFHQISDQAFRSAHPSPRFIKRMQQQHGLKTIINLRGENKTGQYMLELEACKKLGVKLISTPLSSRDAPSKERIINLFKAFDEAEAPLLLHCKSGADRAGLGSALYQLYKNEIPLDESRQLRPSYGHFKSSETGVLDHFIATWNTYHQHNPDVSFLDWVKNDYNPEEVDKTFKASRLGNLLVNKILRRE